MPFISVIPTPGSDIPESSKIFVYGPRFGGLDPQSLGSSKARLPLSTAPSEFRGGGFFVACLVT